MIMIGDAIILETGESDRTEKYKCKLEERENDILFIDYPINTETGKAAFLLDGTRLKCTFVTRDGCPYMFHSVVLGRTKRKIPLLKLSYPGDAFLIRRQRRQYVRVKTAIDVAVHPLNGEFSPFVAVSDDFSAGGVAIFAPNDIYLEKDMNVCLWLALPRKDGEINYLNFVSRVVRINNLNEYQNRVAFEYTGVNPFDRQLMIRFSFEQQLLQREKGLE